MNKVCAGLGALLLLWAIRQCFRRSTLAAGLMALAFGAFGAWFLPTWNGTPGVYWQLTGFAVPAMFVFALTLYKPPATLKPAPGPTTTSPARAFLLAAAVIGLLGCIPGIVVAGVGIGAAWKGDRDGFSMFAIGAGLFVPPALMAWFFWRLAKRANAPQ